MDEEIFGERWKHLSKSKILPKPKPTYKHNKKLLCVCKDLKKKVFKVNVYQ
jgi:hypothetical protein